MNTRIRIDYRLPAVAIAGLLIGALACGCGGTGDAAPTTAATHTATGVARNVELGKQPQPIGDKFSAQNATIAKRDRSACEQAVRSAPALSLAAKREIAALCFRINYIPEDNERTVRSICQEVGNASSTASEAARKRTISACYAAGMR
jgi:Mg-chelatase subunit ChlI